MKLKDFYLRDEYVMNDDILRVIENSVNIIVLFYYQYP